MATTPEYPIISSDDLRVGQEFRYGWSGPWLTAPSSTATPTWVEAKPAPIQAGDRVRYGRNGRSTATVKVVGERWLLVQVDDDDGDYKDAYEDAWAIRAVERVDPNDEADR